MGRTFRLRQNQTVLRMKDAWGWLLGSPKLLAFPCKVEPNTGTSGFQSRSPLDIKAKPYLEGHFRWYFTWGFVLANWDAPSHHGWLKLRPCHCAVRDGKGGSGVLGTFTQIWQRLEQGWPCHFFCLPDCHHFCKDAQTVAWTLFICSPS